jgi:hypothetical protein
MNHKLHTIAALFLSLFLVLAHPQSALAQMGTSLTIIPPKFELFANPGDTMTETIRVKNNSDTPQTYGILIEDFSSAGEEGQVVLEEDEKTANYSLKNWIEPSSRNVVIQAGEETTFPFTITVPKDAEPGGHYASVLFQLGGPTVEGVTNVKHRIGALVLLRVSGNVVEKAQIESFDAPQFSKKSPVIFTLRVKNEGTTHINPAGTVIITDMFGKKVDEIPLMSANVFPGAVRKMLTSWDKPGVIGHFTATLVATYGQQNLPLTAATKFTVISPAAAILILVALVGGGLFVISLVSGRRRLAKAIKVITKGD